MIFLKPIAILLSVVCCSLFILSSNSDKLALHQYMTLRQEDRGMSMGAFTKRVTNPEKLVLVYFHASWCQPCIKLKPEIASLETENQAVCEVLKLDVDDNPVLSEHFEINTLPTFMLYKNGKKVWENNGYQSKQQLQSKIEQFQKK